MSDDAPCYLIDLPPEMLWTVTQFMDNLAIFNLYRTSKGFADISLLAQYVESFAPETWERLSKAPLSPRELGLYWNKINWPIHLTHNQLRHNILSTLLNSTSPSRRFSHVGLFFRDDRKDVYDEIATAIAAHQRLDENFITSNAARLPMDVVCQYQTLSEKFIINNVGSLPWHVITIYQNLSDWFFRQFENYIPWECIYDNKFLSESSKAELLKFHAMCEMERSVEEYNTY